MSMWVIDLRPSFAPDDTGGMERGRGYFWQSLAAQLFPFLTSSSTHETQNPKDLKTLSLSRPVIPFQHRWFACGRKAKSTLRSTAMATSVSRTATNIEAMSEASDLAKRSSASRRRDRRKTRSVEVLSTNKQKEDVLMRRRRNDKMTVTI